MSAGRHWIALRDRVSPEILGAWPATVRITAATYANLSGLGVGVPFYM
jgi:hypothetical protein